MQNFALDGGALNGDPQVWADNSLLVVRTAASGAVVRGANVAGTASLRITTGTTANAIAQLAGDAVVRAAASGAMTYGVAIGSAPKVSLKATANVLRWGMITGDAQMQYKVTGSIAPVSPGSATFSVQMRSLLDLKVSAGRQLESYSAVRFMLNMNPDVKTPVGIAGLAQMRAATLMDLNALLMLPPGQATMQFMGLADSRIADKIDLYGRAAMASFYARGELDVWHHVHAGEMYATVKVSARANAHGKPTIPTLYAEAPSDRFMRVGPEARLFVVPAERRL
jgi:hypothetical protein